MAVSRTAIKSGDRVLVIDDLVATGGTLIAACDLLTSAGATVVECACVVELKALEGYKKLHSKHPSIKVSFYILSFIYSTWYCILFTTFMISCIGLEFD